MDQFETAFLGGYRKDLVDERLKGLITQIDELKKTGKAAEERENRLKKDLEEAQSRMEAAKERERRLKKALEEAQSRMEAAKERENRLKKALEESQGRADSAEERENQLESELEELRNRMESAVDPGEDAAQREEQLKAELESALERLKTMEASLENAESAENGGEDQPDRPMLREELAAAQRWSESLEAELKQVRDEKSAWTQNRLMELERSKALSQRIIELEDELETSEAEHRRELSRLQEQLDHQIKSSAATERILAQAEEEARVMIMEAQDRAQELERQTELDVRTKKQAAARALEGARTQIIQYLDAFNATRNKLSVTYDELGALVDQIPRTDDTVIELEHDGESWSYVPDTEK